jgi:hypothetical protein
MTDEEREHIYDEAWRIIHAFGAERETRAETAATVKVLDRMGAFVRPERDALREAGWFE